MQERKRVIKKLLTPIEKKKVKYIESWVGHEQLRDKLIKAAKDYVNATDVVYNLYGGEELIHNTIAAMNGNIKEIKANRVDPSITIAQKLTNLVNLCAILIHKHNISPSLVHKLKNNIIEK